MGIANDLERLAELHRSGAISDAEFASAKARALGETPQAAKNAVLHWLHLPEVRWLSNPWGIKIAIAAVGTWQWTGYNAIIYLAGLQAIPGDLYEAAKVDGAGPVQ